MFLREYKETFNLDNETVMTWPNYSHPVESPDEIEYIKRNYSALVAYCDDQLGRLLDKMDEENLWEETALIVTTDHGFLLSEHDWWAKVIMPNYQEISHIPLMVYHPEHQDQAGQRRSATTTVIDLMPTVLEWYGCEIPREVKGLSLNPLMKKDSDKERVACTGVFGGQVSYNRRSVRLSLYAENTWTVRGLYEYRLHPCHMRGQFQRRRDERYRTLQGL